MNRRTMLAALAGLGTAGCHRGGTPRRTLRVATAIQYPVASAFFLAEERGYFGDAGFRIQVEPVGAGAQAIPPLATGTLDVAIAALCPGFFNAALRGARVRIVAGRERVVPDSADRALYGRRRSFPHGLGDLRALRGKRIAIHGKATVMEYWLDAMLDRAGLTEKDVEILVMSQTVAMAALSSGTVDAVAGAFFLDKSFAALLPGLVLGAKVGDVLPNTQFSHVLFGRTLLDEPVATGARFLAAYQRGAREFAQGAIPRFLPDLCAKNGWDVGQTAELCRRSATPDGGIDMSSLTRFADWAIAKGYCPPEVRSAAWADARFLEEAHRIEKRGELVRG